MTVFRPLARSTRSILPLALIVLWGCSPNGSKKQYVLAEKLWTDGRYAAAVSEFEKIYAHDPHSKLGHQALYRAATTEAYFLSQYADAVHKFRIYAEVGDDKAMAWEAQRQIGEILFSKMELYDQAIQHYQALLRKAPDNPEAPMFKFRIGKSSFFLWRFSDAVKTYRELIKTYPSSPWAEKAAYEIGVTYYTQGEQHSDNESSRNLGSESYQDAIDNFEAFLKRYPKSELVPQAKFGIASCLEEMDQLDAAYHAYEALRGTYPSPNVIEIKLVRIRERKAQRNR